MGYPKIPFLLLPLTRAEVSGRGQLTRMFGIMESRGSQSWKHAPTREIRGKTHGFLMQLDLRDWAERPNAVARARSLELGARTPV
jgi:hypothetical protein